MFTFAYPELLFLLLLIPALIALFIISRKWRKKKIEKIGNPKTLARLMPNLSPYKSGVRLIVALIAVFGMVFAFARPWGGIKNQETSREGIEIVIAVDASNSMLASATGDVKGPDRMRMAKLLLEKLINRLGNDKVGLIAYAGEAYTLIPVTNDYVSAKAFLNSIEPSMIMSQGTNIGAAIDLAKNSFSENSKVGKAIILLTDAEELENEQGVIEEVGKAAKNGIQTDVIGIGSTPVTIPDGKRGLMIDNETGEIVHTALNEEMALNIAKAGKGIYVNASNEDAIDELMKQLRQLKAVTLESSFMVSHDELYFPFVILAIIMLILDFLITDKRNRWLDKISFFSKEPSNHMILIIITIGILISGSCSGNKAAESDKGGESEVLAKKDSLLQIYSLAKEREAILKGNDFHALGEFERADSNYREALGLNPSSLVSSFNMGVNKIRSIMSLEAASPEGQLPDSIMDPLYKSTQENFRKAAAPRISKSNLSSQAFYNLGNMSFTQKDYSNAIKEYKEALRLNPSDDHARRNLRIAQLQKDQNNNNNQNQHQQNQQDNQNEQKEQKQSAQQPQQQQDRQQINNETSDQILDAAERKENMRRMQLRTEKADQNPYSRRSGKNW